MSIAVQVKILSYFIYCRKHLKHSMLSRFVVHQHKTGRTHFDLRIICRGVLRSWSLLREPPKKTGERRLAIERESYTAVSINSRSFEEDAFGAGRVHEWDSGDVEIRELSDEHLILTFYGARMDGDYEILRTKWYPGNRWMLTRKQRKQFGLTGSPNPLEPKSK
jgi:DNA ligase D-like protein (predicted 3'-phosphoesterase)